MKPGINIKALIPQEGSAKVFTEWVETGVFDALQRSYLKQITLGIYGDATKEDTLIETYQFSITYTKSDGIAIDLLQSTMQEEGGFREERGSSVVPRWPSKAEIKEATIGLLRRLVVLMQTLSPLPAARDLVMKLQYYPEVTPEDYTPTHFTNAMVPSAAPPAELERIKVGCVATGHHALSFSVLSSPAAPSIPIPIDATAPSNPCSQERSHFDTSASEYSAATCGTTSEAVDESGLLQSVSQSLSSQATATPSTEKAFRLAIGPFRRLLAQKEIVTVEQLKTMLLRVGMRVSQAGVVQMLKELQEMGVVGPQRQGRGYPVLS